MDEPLLKESEEVIVIPGEEDIEENSSKIQSSPAMETVALQGILVVGLTVLAIAVLPLYFSDWLGVVCFYCPLTASFCWFTSMSLRRFNTDRKKQKAQGEQQQQQQEEVGSRQDELVWVLVPIVEPTIAVDEPLLKENNRVIPGGRTKENQSHNPSMSLEKKNKAGVATDKEAEEGVAIAMRRQLALGLLLFAVTTASHIFLDLLFLSRCGN